MQAPDSCCIALPSVLMLKSANDGSVLFVRHGTPACHTAFYKMNTVQQCGHLSLVSSPYVLTEKEGMVEEEGERHPCELSGKRSHVRIL